MKTNLLLSLSLFLAAAPLALPATVTNGALDRWKWRHPLPQGNDLYAAAGGNGRIVLVGNKGARVVSTDRGATWHSVAVDTQDTYGVAYGAGRFVTVGESAITNGVTLQSSPDGIHWTQQTVLGSQWTDASGTGLTDVAFGNGMFVAVGRSQTHLISSNGLDWAPYFSTAFPSSVTKIKFTGDRFIVVGSYVSYSMDGRNWHWVYPRLGDADYALGKWLAIPIGDIFWASPGTESYSLCAGYFIPGPTPGGLCTLQVEVLAGEGQYDRPSGRVAFGNGRLVVAGAVGPKGVLYSSDDALTWVDHSEQATDLLYGVAFVEGQFLAMGNHGLLLTSPDGLNWSAANTTSPRNFRSLTYGNGLHVAVGNEGLLMTSPDAVTWTYQTIPTTNNLRGVAFKDGLFVAVGEADEAGTIMLVSSDGLSWRRWYLNIANGIYDITASTNLFVAVGANGEVETSSDGRYWFSQTVTNICVITSGPWAGTHVGNPYFNSIVWGGGLFVAVGSSAINTSTDGIHWTPQACASTLNYIFQAVSYGNGMFVVAGQNGYMMISTNGVDWSSPTRSTTRDIEDIFYAQGQFVAVGEKGYLATSTNGLVWTERATYCQNDLRGVAHQGGRFLAVGNNETILQSGFMGPPVLHARGLMGTEGFELSVEGESGRAYTVQASDDLENWEDVMSFTNDEETTLFLDPDAGWWLRRFYRVAVP